MIDASGVPGTTGIFAGNLHAIGSYDECVNVEVKDQKFCGINIPQFVGRYVLATLVPATPSEKSEKSLS